MSIQASPTWAEEHPRHAGLCPRCGTPELCECNCLDGVPPATRERWHRIMPLHAFDGDHGERIRRQIESDTPPPRWWGTGSPDMPRPIAWLESRGWWEWHWARGIYPGEGRASIPRWMRERVIERDGYVCQLCREPVTPDDIHLDHIKPHSKGGPDTVANLRVAHSLCNIRRGNRED